MVFEPLEALDRAQAAPFLFAPRPAGVLKDFGHLFPLSRSRAAGLAHRLVPDQVCDVFWEALRICAAALTVTTTRRCVSRSSPSEKCKVGCASAPQHSALPTFARTGECTRMTNDARIEIRLPEQRLRSLVELAAEKGVSRADLVRIGINWLIEHPDAILKFPEAA